MGILPTSRLSQTNEVENSSFGQGLDDHLVETFDEANFFFAEQCGHFIFSILGNVGFLDH
ncbi:hypothetical protein N7528_007759 [Penicillium herquei]|nr:hypothetical protein N7528_007759 [Penicillium herquei]